MERSRTTASAVAHSVSGELDQGLRTQERRPRRSAILVTFCSGVKGVCFLGDPCVPVEGFQPSGGICADAYDFSTFLLSRVSECLITSYLAEVKLLLMPLDSEGDSVATASPVTLSSAAEPEDFVRIELSGQLHTNSAGT